MLIKKKKSTKELVQNSPNPERPGHAKGENGRTADRPHRSPKDVVKSKPFLGGLCVFIGVLVAFVIMPLAQAQLNKTAQVVVFTQDVSAGVLVTNEMVALREMGAINLPAGTLMQTADAVGKYTTVAAVQGDVLTARRLQNQYPTDDPSLLALPKGMLAMSANLTDLAQSVSGKLRAGDIIQLFAVIDTSLDNADLSALAIPELQFVEVLAVTNNKAQDIQSGELMENATDDSRQIATVTLAVNPKQAAVLAGYNRSATLHAALVTRGEPTAKATALAAQEEFFFNAEIPVETPPPDATVTPSAPPPA